MKNSVLVDKHNIKKKEEISYMDVNYNNLICPTRKRSKKISEMCSCKQNLRILYEYIKYIDDEELIRDYQSKIKEYEKRIEDLMEDITLIELQF